MMKKLTKRLTALIVLPTAFLLSSQQVSALVILEFDQTPGTLTGGTLNYSGNQAESLFGNGITFDTITVSGTGLTETTYNISTVLDFSTGNNITEGNSLGDSWIFNPSAPNTFNLTSSGENILSGNFIGNPGNPQIVQGSNGGFTFSGGGNNTINSVFLANNLGVIVDSSGFMFATTEIAASGAIIDDSTGSFSAKVQNGDLTSFTLSIGAAPTPSSGATLSMLGIGLSFLVLARRGIFFAKSALK